MIRCRRPRFLAAFMFLASLLLAGCTADKKPSQLEETLATFAKDVAIPLQATSQENPVPLSEEVIGEGQAIYGQACSLCHGANGRAQAELGMALYPPAIDLTSPHVLSWNDGELFWIIQNGIRLTGMPAWRRTISPEDTWKLVHFLRQLPNQAEENAVPPEFIPDENSTARELMAYGELLYRQQGCFMCHQLNGEGGTIGPDLTLQGDRGRTDEWLLGHFKEPAEYTKGSMMPSYRNMTEEQLLSLVVFLQNQTGASAAPPSSSP